MKKYLTMIAAAALVLACSNETEDLVIPSSGNAIAFSASTDGNSTRAIGEIADQAALQTLTFEASNRDRIGDTKTGVRGIGIFGCYTGKLKYEQTTVSCDFMYNQQVTWDNASSTWKYNPVKYWPNENNDYLSFFAYAPYEPDPQDDGRCIIEISDNYELGDPWLNYRLSKNPWGLITDTSDPAYKSETQVDLMYGTKKTGTSAPYTYSAWTDQQHFKQDGTLSGDVTLDNKVEFTFKHALACVGDEIRIKLAQDAADKLNGYAKIKLNKLTIAYKNLTNKARLVLNPKDGEANWKEIISGELTTTRTFVKEFTDVEIVMGGTSPGATATVAGADAIAEGYLVPSTDDKGNGLFYIPLQIAGTDKAYAEVTLNYTVDNGVTKYTDDATTQFDLDMNLEGKSQNIVITLLKDLDLHHLVFVLSSDAAEPSYGRLFK